MRLYWEVARTTARRQATYRTATLAGIFTNTVFGFILAYVMVAVFRARPEIGGFDQQFWIAGDDVDVCWRLMERGGTLGFAASAVVWHHRRGSARAFWRQQVNYGRAEALLEVKWPQKYNGLGHLIWRGRLYSDGGGGRAAGRVRYGTWGSELFQPREGAAASHVGIRSLPRLPEWYLVLFVLGGLAGAGAFWHPARWAMWALAAVHPLAWPLLMQRFRALEPFDSLAVYKPLAKYASKE